MRDEIPVTDDVSGKAAAGSEAVWPFCDKTVLSACVTAESGDNDTDPSDDGSPVKSFTPF